MFPSSPEGRLLLACSTTADPALVKELVQKELDWDWIVTRAKSYSLAPLVYCTVRKLHLDQQIQPDFVEQLRLEYRRSCAAGINQLIKTEEILSAFSRERISVVLLKGAALAATVYQGVGLRPMLDLDLLLPPGELARGAAVLRRLGYLPDEFYKSAQWYRDNHHHWEPYSAPDRTLSVELHHHIAPLRAVATILPLTFWESVQTVRVGSETALVLSPTHLLFSVCLHVGVGQYFEKTVRDIVDIAEILDQHEKDLDWGLLLSEVTGKETGRSLYYSLWLVQFMTGAVVPKAVLKELKSRCQLSFLVDACLRFMIRRAVFPDFTHVSPVIVTDTIRALLNPPKGRGSWTTLFLSLFNRLSQSRSRRHLKESFRPI